MFAKMYSFIQVTYVHPHERQFARCRLDIQSYNGRAFKADAKESAIAWKPGMLSKRLPRAVDSSVNACSRGLDKFCHVEGATGSEH